MAKKRSIVKRTKSRACLALTALLAAGWMLAAYVALANDDMREQDAMIAMARGYVDKWMSGGVEVEVGWSHPLGDWGGGMGREQSESRLREG